MKKIFFLLFISSLMACLRASAVTDSLPLIRHIELVSTGKLIIRQGEKQEIKVIDEKGSKGSGIRIKGDKLIVDDSYGREFDITVVALESIDISGYGSIVSDSALKGERLEVKISGNGKVSLIVDYDYIDAHVSGVGKIELSGEADSVRFRISGSGKINAGELKVSKCQASISGLGKCTVDVRDELVSDISGSGKVDFVTEPKRIETEISGVGRVGAFSGSSTSGSKDTTLITFGNYDVLVIGGDKDSPGDAEQNKPSFPMLELGLNPFVERTSSFGSSAPELLTEKCVSVGLNFFQQSWEFGKSNIWLTTRIGITWNNYRWMGGNVQMIKGDSAVAFEYQGLIDTSASTPSVTREYKKSKLTTSYITVPLMVNFLTSRNPKRTCTIGAGGIVGLRLGSHSKEVFSENGEEIKQKGRSDFYLSPFRYGVRGSLGYRNFSLFADYYFSDVFREGRGPVLTPLNFGITIVGFEI